MKKLANVIMTYPKSCLALVVLATLAVSPFGLNTEFETSFKSFILENDKDYANYENYRHQFGQDDVLVVAFQDAEIFTNENIALIRRLTDQIEALENIYDVRSLSNAEYMKSTSDSFEAVPLIDEDTLSKEMLTHAKDIALKHEVFQNDLISLDSKSTSILVTFQAKDDNYKYTKEIQAVERIVAEESQRSGKAIYIAGERYIDNRFLEYIHKDLNLFIPLTCLILALLLYVMLRDIRYTLIGFAAISACLMWTGSVIPLAGWKMNSIIAALPSLILCIAVTDVIHILHAYRRLLPKSKDLDQALRRTLQEVMLPCFLTSLTTGVGFGSLILNEVHPVKGFGILAAICIMLCFPLCIVIVATLLKLFDKSKSHSIPIKQAMPRTDGQPSLMIRWARLLRTRRNIILGGSLAVIGIASLGILNLHVEVDRVSYLKESSELHKGVAFIDNHLAGTTQMDIWVDGGRNQEGVVKEPWLLKKIEGLTEFLRQQPEISKVISINDFLKEMNKAFYAGDDSQYIIPTTREQTAQFLLIYSMSGRRNEVDKYVDYPYSQTRLSVRTAEHNSSKLSGLIERINDYLGANFKDTPVKLGTQIASISIPNNNVFHYLMKGLLIGILSAVLVVGFIMCLTFRSLYAGWVSMIPNLIPIMVSLGILGWLGYPLEIATAMSFSIALGIAVDDTIHFMSRFRLELSRHGNYEDAMEHTLSHLGPALAMTTCVIMGGFLVLVFASLKMNIIFGILAASIMFVTFLADLTITPICLMLFKPFPIPQSATPAARTSKADSAPPPIQTASITPTLSIKTSVKEPVAK